MAKCKNCGIVLSRLNKDVCPFCGTKNPLEEGSTETVDYTKAFEKFKEEEAPVEVTFKSRKTLMLLTALLGFFGAGQFYLGKWKIALEYLLLTAIAVGGGFLLFFTANFKNPFAFIIPLLIEELLFLIQMFVIKTDTTIKDSKGQYIR